MCILIAVLGIYVYRAVKVPRRELKYSFVVQSNIQSTAYNRKLTIILVCVCAHPLYQRVSLFFLELPRRENVHRRYGCNVMCLSVYLVVLCVFTQGFLIYSTPDH